jgi:hypothetical protein
MVPKVAVPMPAAASAQRQSELVASLELRREGRVLAQLHGVEKLDDFVVRFFDRVAEQGQGGECEKEQ